MSEKSIKCTYEGGYFKPVEHVDLRNIKRISIMVVDKPKHLKERLKEGYEATAAASKEISEESFCAENEIDCATPWER